MHCNVLREKAKLQASEMSMLKKVKEGARIGRYVSRHLCSSHIGLVSNGAGLVAAQVEQKKNRKYAELLLSHHFIPIAIETGRVFGPEFTAFLRALG